MIAFFRSVRSHITKRDIAVRSRGEVCPMPLGQIVPHVTEKGYISCSLAGGSL
jgi:hypothetical protein